jgi:hypothetical protein
MDEAGTPEPNYKNHFIKNDSEHRGINKNYNKDKSRKSNYGDFNRRKQNTENVTENNGDRWKWKTQNSRDQESRDQKSRGQKCYVHKTNFQKNATGYKKPVNNNVSKFNEYDFAQNQTYRGKHSSKYHNFKNDITNSRQNHYQETSTPINELNSFPESSFNLENPSETSKIKFNNVPSTQSFISTEPISTKSLFDFNFGYQCYHCHTKLAENQVYGMLTPDETFEAILLVVSCHTCLPLYGSVGRVQNKDLRKYFCNQHVDDEQVKFLEPKVMECRICQQRTCIFCEKCVHLRENQDNGKKIMYESVVYDGKKGKKPGFGKNSNKMLNDFDDLMEKIDVLKNSNLLEICLEKLIQKSLKKNDSCYHDENPNELDSFDLTQFKNEISAQTHIDLEKHTYGRKQNKNDIKYNSGELIHNLFLESTKRRAQFQSVEIEKLPNFKDLLDFTLGSFKELSSIAESQAKHSRKLEK